MSLIFSPERLTSARKRLHLSQAELAAAAGVSKNTVGNAETGRHRPREVAALAAALGLSVDDLYVHDNDATETAEGVREAAAR